jgi:hypothetical protein
MMLGWNHHYNVMGAKANVLSSYVGGSADRPARGMRGLLLPCLSSRCIHFTFNIAL